MTPPDVLVEYDPDISLFAQLETARQEEEKYKTASTKEKTARSLQKIIDNSMVRLTLSEQRINNSVNNLAKPETVDKMKESVSNFMSKPRTMPTVGLGRAPVFLNKYSMAKKFTTKDGESDDKKTESIQEEDKSKPATKPMDKMNFKLPSLPSSLPSEKDIDSKETTDSAPSSEDKAEEPSTDTEKKEEPAASPSKKMSTAFASFTQRVQQQSNKTISSSPVASDNTTPDSEDTPVSTTKSLTFSSFANRIKQVKVTDKDPERTNKSAPPSEDKAVDADNTISESPSKKVSSAFASLKSAAASALDNKQSSTTEGETVEEKSISSFSSFTNRIKVNKSEPPTVSSSEERKDATADPKADEKSEEESPKEATSDRLNKFKLSMGTSLSGFREKVAESRASNSPATGKDDEGKATDTSNTDVSMLSNKFTTSFSSMKSKFTTSAQPTTATTSSSEQKGEEGSVSTTLSSLGKLLTTDEPRPKTRFQRADEEEAISFDSDEAQTSTVSTADESNDLLLGLDSDLTDVSLTNSGSGEDKEDKPQVEKEALKETTESESTQ